MSEPIQRLTGLIEDFLAAGGSVASIGQPGRDLARVIRDIDAYMRRDRTPFRHSKPQATAADNFLDKIAEHLKAGSPEGNALDMFRARLSVEGYRPKSEQQKEVGLYLLRALRQHVEHGEHLTVARVGDELAALASSTVIDQQTEVSYLASTSAARGGASTVLVFALLGHDLPARGSSIQGAINYYSSLGGRLQNAELGHMSAPASDLAALRQQVGLVMSPSSKPSPSLDL